MSIISDYSLNFLGIQPNFNFNFKSRIMTKPIAFLATAAIFILAFNSVNAQNCSTPSPSAGLSPVSITYGQALPSWVDSCALMDGNESGARWSTSSTDATTPVTFTIELQSVLQFDQLKIAYRKGDERKADFSIDVSPDGTNWTNALNHQQSNGSTVDFETFDIPVQNAKFVKYLGYGVNFNSNGNWGNGNEIYEIQILNTGSSNGGGSNQNNCNDFVIRYRLNGTWFDAGNTITVDQGDELVLEGTNTYNVTITHPNGSQTGNGVWLGTIDATETGTYTVSSNSGCSATVEIILNSTDPDPDPDPNTNSEPLNAMLFEDGFENPSSLLDSGPWYIESTNAQLVGNAREGNFAISFSDDNGGARSEFSIDPPYYFDWYTEYWHGFSIKIVEPTNGYQNVIQHHALPEKDSDGNIDWSVIAGTSGFTVSTVGANNLTLHTATDSNYSNSTDPGAKHGTVEHPVTITQNEWVDVVMHFRYADDNTGFMEVWVDGVPVVDIQSQPTVYPLTSSGNRKTEAEYGKIGVYGGSGFTGEAHYDAYRIWEGSGGSFDLVKPRDTPGSGPSPWASTSGSQDINYTAGNVGIGTTNIDGWQLAVGGKIRAQEIKVETGWADYVFLNDYKLPTLQEVEQHIQEKGHLINIPSSAQVEANGIELGEMNKLLLEKIEELTLYILQQEKRIQILEQK